MNRTRSCGQAPSELALNSAGFTPLAFANALRIGSSSPVYVAGLLRREPRIAPWSIDTTPAPAAPGRMNIHVLAAGMLGCRRVRGGRQVGWSGCGRSGRCGGERSPGITGKGVVDLASTTAAGLVPRRVLSSGGCDGVAPPR